jgi:hypothetical protein
VGWPDDWCGRMTGGTRYSYALNNASSEVIMFELCVSGGDLSVNHEQCK